MGVVRRWALAATVTALVAACGQSTVPSASPSASSTDLSPYGQLFAQVGPNGEVTKEMALEAFSLAIAPLPGVTVPNGPSPSDAEAADGTFAILWLLPYRDQITPDQRAAMDAALQPDPNAPEFTPGELGTKVVLAAAHSPIQLQRAALMAKAPVNADNTAVQYWTDRVKYAINVISGKLGRSLSVPWSLVINATQIKSQKTLAYDTPYLIQPFGTLDRCEIHVEPSLVGANDDAEASASMAHEIFHCFQFDYFANHGGFHKLPDWIEEGQAEWVGEVVGGPSVLGTEWWASYLNHQTVALYGRTYDAVGFYQHMYEEGIDPWSHVDPMLATSDNTDAFKAAGATADTFLDTWSSGLFRDSTLGSEWAAQAPWDTNAKTAPQDSELGNGDLLNVAADPLLNTDYKVVSTADIVEVRITGHARLSADGVTPQLPLEQRWLCTDSGGCKCPPGKRYSGPELEQSGVTVRIALTGALAGASGIVRGHATDEFCKPLTTPPPSCQSNCGNSNGDPHLRTINRYRYNFQGAGEFELLKTPDSSIDIQARQEPYGSDFFVGVSTNTAVAAGVNGHEVSVYATDGGLIAHVDGQAVDPGTAPDLGSGAALKRTDNGLEIDFPDGTVLWTLSVGHWGINAVIQPSAALSADGIGLLGPITPGGIGLPALPDGTQLPAAPNTEARDKTMYGQFADAWRVTVATSLFDYDAGKSTETYTDRNFPSDADRHELDAALASPDPTQHAAAESACSGITDPDLKDECEYDVYATGDSGFAQQYAVQQDLYDSGIAPPSAPPTATSGPTTGPTGVQKVVDLQDLDGSAVGPDDTLYVSISDSSGTAQLLAVDPTTAAIKTQVQMRVATALHFGADSVWADGQVKDANGQYCSVTRYDAATLADQGDYALPCPGFAGLTSMGDALWFIDETNLDTGTGAGAVLTQIDPATNAPGKSVPLPYSGGCCRDSQGAVFCSCGQSDVWRLTESDPAFVDLGNYSTIYPAGTGFWTEQDPSALLVNGPSSTTAVPLQVATHLVGGDAAGIYVQGEQTGQDVNYPLLRQPLDGSAPIRIATAPTYGSDLTLTMLDYSPQFPSFSLPDGYVHLWEFKETPDSHLALWIQWAPLP